MHQPLVFERSLVVVSSHLDELHHVNNVVYVQWVQDVAEAHWRQQASVELQSKYAWVVLRHEIDYKRAARLGDALTLRTWVDTMEGVKSDRVVQAIRESDGDLITQARSTWCLLEAAQQRPIRIPVEIKSVFWQT